MRLIHKTTLTLTHENCGKLSVLFFKDYNKVLFY